MEQEKSFWLFDFNYDCEKLQKSSWQRRRQLFYYFWYGLTIIYSLVYILIWQKRNKFIDSDWIILIISYICLAVFLILEVVFILLMLRITRQTSSVTFLPFNQEDAETLYKKQDDLKNNENLKMNAVSNALFSNTAVNSNQIGIGNAIISNNVMAGNTGNQAGMTGGLISVNSLANRVGKQEEEGGGNIKSGNIGFVRSDKKLGIGSMILENESTGRRVISDKKRWRGFIKCFGSINIVLVMIFGHFVMCLCMILRMPLYDTHWIIIGINMFDLVTGNMFTIAAAFNILVNLIRDDKFLNQCIHSNSLNKLLFSLVYSAGYYYFILTLFSLFWGSAYTLTFSPDIPSILSLIFLVIIAFVYQIKQYIHRE